MGGSAKRMGTFAEVIANAIGHHKKEMVELDISKTDRFSFYKIGPVLSVNVRRDFSLTNLLQSKAFFNSTKYATFRVYN